MVDIREEIGAEKSALGEKDAFATQAQLLAEKRRLLPPHPRALTSTWRVW